ncbi:MAG: DNA polymerase [Candidatus Izemoplasmatales bacterium]
MKGEICLKCKLHETCKNPFMDSSGSVSPRVLVIGEAPGETEDKRNEPFVGTAGELFRNVLSEVGFNLDDMRFTNVVRCRPPNNKITQTAINYCSQFALEDIETYNPEMVIVTGNSALQGILGENGIKDWSGNIIEKNGRIYVPVYHPAYILRNKTATDEWLESLLKACDALEGVFEEEVGSSLQIVLPNTIAQVQDMQEYLSKYEKIAYDVETSSLDPYSKSNFMLAVSFAAGNKMFSLPTRHPESYWKGSDLVRVEKIICEILDEHDGKLEGQNIKFDLLHTRAQFGKMYRACDDTMLLSSLIDPAPGKHGLKRLSATYLGWYDHESEMDEYAREHPEADAKRKGTYAKMPLKILLPYSAKDSGAVLLLRDILYEKLTHKQKILYDELVMEISNFLTEIEYNGMTIDKYIAERYKKIYGIVAEELYEKLLQDKLVKRMTKDKHLDPKNKKWKFNPRSSLQMVEFVYVYGKMPITVRTKNVDKAKCMPSTKAAVLETYIDRMPVLKPLLYYRVLRNALSKYLDAALTAKWLSDDGMVHTNYKANGTETGRIASEHPNILNIPTEEKMPGTLLEYLPIKNIFTSRFGKDGVLLSLDESAMELRVISSVAECEPMLDAFRSGRDIHTAVSSMVTGIDYDKIDKETRYYYKRVNWTIIFDGTANTLHTRYRIPMKKAEQLFEDYFNEFPQIAEYIQNTIKSARKTGYSESPFGRRRYYTYIRGADDSPAKAADERSSVNMPIQSAASDILFISAIIARKEMVKRGMDMTKIFLINTVYDSVVIDCKKEVVVEVAELFKEIMENVIYWAGIYMPKIDFSWLICPLKADAEIGSHYGNKIKLEDWIKENAHGVAG